MLLLNTKSQSWSFTPGSSGNRRSGLCWEDVASALSMGNLDKMAYYLARAKYCQDGSSVEKLFYLVQQEATRLAKTHQWGSRGETLTSLAQLACYESLDTMLCKSCAGRGYKTNGKECKSCNGYGRKPMSMRSRYLMAGFDKRNWERRWYSRYEKLYQTLCDAENDALAHLSHQLTSKPSSGS